MLKYGTIQSAQTAIAKLERSTDEQLQAYISALEVAVLKRAHFDNWSADPIPEDDDSLPWDDERAPAEPDDNPEP